MTALLMAYRLHLIGYKKIESDTETPADYSTVKDDDPYPIIVFGLNKPVSSNKIGRYLNSEFYHYLKIYKNIKNYGLPYDNWLNAPKWILDLIDKFDSVTEEYNRYKLSKGII
jgi:hypothetical protein